MNRRATYLYLGIVLVLLFAFSLYEYFRNLDIESSGKNKSYTNASILDRIPGDELKEISGDPGKKLIVGLKININNAGWHELSYLPGISDAVARDIVKYRERAGKFIRLEELMKVRGIKEKRFRKIQPFIEL